MSTGLSHKVGGYGSYTDVDQANMLASISARGMLSAEDLSSVPWILSSLSFLL